MTPLETEKGFCDPCVKPRCEICKHITKTHQSESFSRKRMYSIRPQDLNYTSKNKDCLFSCKTCHKQYTGSTEEFQSRFDNYKGAHRNFLRNEKFKQESFQAHLAEDLHQADSDWEVTLIDQAESVDDLRWRKSYW